MDPITSALDHLTLGTPVTADNLAMFPLLLPDEAAPRYLVLDDAIAAGVATVTEVSEAGMVPELLVSNTADTPVLILDGEELTGAKQNRIVNLSILVAAHQKLHIPVSCVEAGRWARRSREFATAGRAHYASGRARKLAQVSCAMSEDGSRLADQGDVWRGIDMKAERLNASSDTRAAAAMFEGAQLRLEGFVERFDPLPGQVGALFTINGLIAGLDLFDSQATWRRSARKLVQSYGLDAVDSLGSPEPSAKPRPKAFLTALKKAPRKNFQAIGLGEDVRIDGSRIIGGGLVAEGQLVHLVAFPAIADAH
jgi:hypothetical protein